MVSRSTTSTRRKPDSARFFNNSHPMPPEPMSNMREFSIEVSNVGPREACRPRRMGGQDDEEDGGVLLLASPWSVIVGGARPWVFFPRRSRPQDTKVCSNNGTQGSS